MKKGWRKIHLYGNVYQYKIGRHSVYIILPSGHRVFTTQCEVAELSWYELERGYWKGWFTGITPGHVKRYITNNLSPNV